jgi:spore germination protein GerM
LIPLKNRLNCIVLGLFIVPLLSGCAGNRTILSEDTEHRKTVTSVARFANKKQIAPAVRNALLIWFVKNDGDKITYEPVARLYQPGSGSEEQTPSLKAVEAAVSELVKGPTTDEEASGFGSEVPRGTVLISVAPTKDRSGIVLNLSKRFLSGSGAQSFGLRLEQLKRTVNEIVGHDSPPKAVFLNVEGERLSQATGDGIDVAQPINQ